MKPESPTRGLAAWDAQRAALAAISTELEAGRETKLDGYSQAVCYFERVTGLPAHDDGTYIGRLPTGHLKDDLEQWDRWLLDNRTRVSIDLLDVPVQCLAGWA